MLKASGLRVTSPRVKVLEVFAKHQSALAHNDIEAELVDMDRITLYRTLKIFNDKGLIHIAIDASDKTKYALCQHECDEEHHHDHHPHFYCIKCQQTVCLEEVIAPPLQVPKGYRVTDVQIAMKGVCPICS